ncbi:MAG: hypothetical protein ACKO0Z_26335 [Betaproteobacteria bacterium]
MKKPHRVATVGFGFLSLRLSYDSVGIRRCEPAQLAQLLDADIKRWGDVIQKAGIPLQ